MEDPWHSWDIPEKGSGADMELLQYKGKVNRTTLCVLQDHLRQQKTNHLPDFVSPTEWEPLL